jgi:tetratricopeptide (TPR) repeat protein
MGASDGIWELQRRYFRERGPEAWRSGEVPHYVTNNPFMAETYARLVLALARDRLRLDGGAAQPEEPIHVVELGAGSGRLAYHFLRRLEAISADEGVEPPPVRYVLSDFAEANLAHWRRHPWFARDFAAGRLDIARFDLTAPGDLKLELSGAVIGPGALAAPLVVIANYVFDSVPQDVFRIRKGRLWRAEMAAAAPGDCADPGQALAAADLRWTYRPVEGPAYPDEPALSGLVEAYRTGLKHTHVAAPAAALRALQRLSRLSRRGLMLLSADKGDCTLDALEGRGAPGLARHGSVSASVNFHALAQACVLGGGVARTPAEPHTHIAVVMLLTGPEAERHSEALGAYDALVGGFGPDAFYAMTVAAAERLDELDPGELLELLRVSRYDARQFLRVGPRLIALAAELDAGRRAEAAEAIGRIWAGYFPLGEDADVVALMGSVLYALDLFTPAAAFIERSMALYGADSGSLFNLAACRFMLGRTEDCAALLARVLEADPGNGEAAALLQACRPRDDAGR